MMVSFILRCFAEDPANHGGETYNQLTPQIGGEVNGSRSRRSNSTVVADRPHVNPAPWFRCPPRH